MKTKNKTIAMVEIAVVLFSVFLVALPVMAIATEQATQKVSTSEVTTASEDDYVLDIYGNANEDDTIDMGDVVYTKLAIFGKKPKTELCDAKYDERINVLDVIQTKLIILGKEKELTIIDFADRIVTVKMPIERVITFMPTDIDAMRMLGAKNKIVGVSTSTTSEKIYFPEISKLPDVGNTARPDIEAIISLKPDVVITYHNRVTRLEKLPDNIPAVGTSLHHPADIRDELMKLGYIIDKRDEAKHYFEDFHDKYIDLIKARTEGISEEERPKIYFVCPNPYRTYGSTSYVHQKIVLAGGRNIFADITTPATAFMVDPEEVIKRNPDIIIQKQFECRGNLGYGLDDSSLAEAARDAIMTLPELANVNAVKNERVYLILGEPTNGLSYPVAIAYYAKWFYPELFEDLDPKAIHQEFIDNFCPGLDFNVYEHGVFEYPPFE